MLVAMLPFTRRYGQGMFGVSAPGMPVYLQSCYNHCQERKQEKSEEKTEWPLIFAEVLRASTNFKVVILSAKLEGPLHWLAL
ncbi:MAG: hypothetical protein LAP21_16610 [Acidobacteriia bacterium]|nr:hypothetical protein [Terriglobia bacterium]